MKTETKKKTKKKKGVKRFFIVLIILLVMGASLVGIDFYQKVYTPFKEYKDAITIQVDKGASVSSVGKLLFREKIISSYNYFRIYYRLYFEGASFKSGEYRFGRPMNMRQVIEKLNQGKVVLYKVTVKEGLINKEIAAVMERQRNIKYEDFINSTRNVSHIEALDPEAEDLEGYLYPDTYHIRKDISAAEIVRLMVGKFKENFTDAMKFQAEKLGLSIREIVTMASLIEKETASREERFLIASVFHNRLRIGMPMGCDPTIIYALKRDDLYRGKLGWKELKYDSPYNSRLHKGLPPGPICSPGYASIEAALYPETTKYLYFVAKNYKTHYFSKNLKEHNWAVRKYIINRKRN
ncbi:MAG: endolytic transglycosylase MltG [bacterium]|nr:endolytic transglycosylase MltG [bacterium]